MTEQFLRYVKGLSLEPVDNPKCVEKLSNNRYLPDHSVVLQGAEVFNLFFEGTSFQDVDERENEVTKNLRTEWFKLDAYFQDALADIAE